MTADLTRDVVYRGFLANDADIRTNLVAGQPVSGCVIDSWDDSDFDVVQYSEKRSQQDGMDVGDVLLGARRLHMAGTLYGVSRADLFDKAQQMRAAFSPTLAQRESPADHGYRPVYFSVPTTRIEDYPSGVIDLRIDGLVRRFQFVDQRDMLGGEDVDPLALMWQATLVARDARIKGADPQDYPFTISSSSQAVATDSSWKTLDLSWRDGTLNAEPSGWHDFGFDDAAWDAAYLPPDPTKDANMVPGAHWLSSQARADGHLSFAIAIARKDFTLTDDAVDAVTLLAAVDNWCEIWLDDVLVLSLMNKYPTRHWDPHNWTTIHSAVIPAASLTAGDHCLAVKMYNDDASNSWLASAGGGLFNPFIVAIGMVVPFDTNDTFDIVNRGDYHAPLNMLIAVGSDAGTLSVSVAGSQFTITVPASTGDRIIRMKGEDKVLTVEEDNVETLRMDLIVFQNDTTWPLIPAGGSTVTNTITGTVVTASGTHLWYYESFA